MMQVEAGFGRQVAMLVAATINDHLVIDYDESRPVWTCCPHCCGPCAALVYFRDNPMARRTLAEWFMDWGTDWEWCGPNGQIKWRLIERHWRDNDCDCEETE